MMRATTSGPLPAVRLAMIVTGLSGKVSARTGVQAKLLSTASNQAPHRRKHILAMSLTGTDTICNCGKYEAIYCQFGQPGRTSPVFTSAAAPRALGEANRPRPIRAL